MAKTANSEKHNPDFLKAVYDLAYHKADAKLNDHDEIVNIATDTALVYLTATQAGIVIRNLNGFTSKVAESKIYDYYRRKKTKNRTENLISYFDDPQYWEEISDGQADEMLGRQDHYDQQEKEEGTINKIFEFVETLDPVYQDNFNQRNVQGKTYKEMEQSDPTKNEKHHKANNHRVIKKIRTHFKES